MNKCWSEPKTNINLTGPLCEFGEVRFRDWVTFKLYR